MRNFTGKIVSCLAAIAMLAGGAISASAEIYEQRSVGDINNDGLVNAVDATEILQYSAYRGTGGEGTIQEWHNRNKDIEDEEPFLELGDVTNDGVVNAVDATCVLQYSAYKGTGGEGTLEDWYTDQEYKKENPEPTQQETPSGPIEGSPVIDINGVELRLGECADLVVGSLSASFEYDVAEMEGFQNQHVYVYSDFVLSCTQYDNTAMLIENLGDTVSVDGITKGSTKKDVEAKFGESANGTYKLGDCTMIIAYSAEDTVEMFTIYAG